MVPEIDHGTKDPNDILLGKRATCITTGEIGIIDEVRRFKDGKALIYLKLGANWGVSGLEEDFLFD